MLDETLNKNWKIDFFKIFATDYDNPSELEKADKLKFEHFPPVIAKFYDEIIDENILTKICQGSLKITKAKNLTNYNGDLIKINYLKTIKAQLNNLMQQQIAKLNQEDPNFLDDEEKKIIEESEFPFIKLMTLVYTKDTNEMTKEEQDQWKKNMNSFINQQILFGVVNTYYTMKLYQDNNYVSLFQTPYNKKELWNEYVNDMKGFCVAYDFKQIKESTVKQLNRIFPVLYTKNKLSQEDLDYGVYNIHCASLIFIKDSVSEYDNEWMYILNHHYTEREYLMLDSLLEPIYAQTMEYGCIKEITSTNYLELVDGEMEYQYNKIIDDIAGVLESDEFKQNISKSFEEVLNITDDDMEIEFMKPEAIYLGKNFPEDKISSFEEIAKENNVKIFKIKEKDGKLFKALV